MKTRPLGTTDLQFRLGMSYLAAVGVGIFSFSIWGFLIQLGDSISWGTWYYPAGFTVFVALCVFLSPEKTLGILADLLKVVSGKQDL